MKDNNNQKQPDVNRDPLSEAAGAHPMGVGVGSAGGATMGAAVGSFAGPLGAAVGAVVGGLAGGLAGRNLAELANPTIEDAYWRQNYLDRPYVKNGAQYHVYEPAYRFGWEGRSRYRDLNWVTAEPHLRADWLEAGTSTGGWDTFGPAIRDAWDRFPNEIDRGSRV
jgi:hypothetical protein